MKTYLLLPALWLMLSCTSISNNEKDLSLPFDVTGSEEAMPFFQKGLLLLHNFQYGDAAEAFIEAQKIDPDFVMAYWGEAMSYDHPVWRDLDIDKSRSALNRLGETQEARLGKTKTDVEKDFIQAIEILFGEGSKPDREKNYSAFMEKVVNRYPGHHEVAAFYALSLLGIKNGWNKMEDMNFKAAEICEAILKENPDHPGALHYLIHANDHPQYAKFSLTAARVYDKVASYSDHALHMPSHIYLALGMWDEVVSSNEISWKASVDRKEEKDFDNNELGYHSHRWLQYGYLQQGRHTDALEVLKNQIRFTTEQPSPSARTHLIFMKGDYLTHTNNWNSEMAEVAVETQDLSLPIRCLNYFLEGSRAFHQGNKAVLRQIVQVANEDIVKATAWKEENDNMTICGVQAFVNRVPTQNALNEANEILLYLKGMLAWLEGEHKEAEKWLLEACEKEDSELGVFGPPFRFKLARELYAEFLLSHDRPQEALDQFELALNAAPNRLLPLKGALKAAQQINHQQKMQLLQKKVDEILSKADDHDAKANI
jgi:tetratricopeptide (TPR) repeat protein